MKGWARKLIADLDSEILVSTASASQFESEAGKLPGAVEFENVWPCRLNPRKKKFGNEQFDARPGARTSFKSINTDIPHNPY